MNTQALLLPIIASIHEENLSLDSLLAEFLRVENLASNDVCDHVDSNGAQTGCLSHGRLASKFEILKWPSVLVVCIKRTKWSNGLSKHDEHVKFDAEWRIKDNICYTLKSIAVHTGKHFATGHYTAFVRDESGIWFFCDDKQQPKQVHLNTVLAAQAYILFYEKKDAANLIVPASSSALR